MKSGIANSAYPTSFWDERVKARNLCKNKPATWVAQVAGFLNVDMTDIAVY
jgi:hypothetical protein